MYMMNGFQAWSEKAGNPITFDSNVRSSNDILCLKQEDCYQHVPKEIFTKDK